MFTLQFHSRYIRWQETTINFCALTDFDNQSLKLLRNLKDQNPNAIPRLVGAKLQDKSHSLHIEYAILGHSPITPTRILSVT